MSMRVVSALGPRGTDSWRAAGFSADSHQSTDKLQITRCLCFVHFYCIYHYCMSHQMWHSENTWTLTPRASVACPPPLKREDRQSPMLSIRVRFIVTVVSQILINTHTHVPLCDNVRDSISLVTCLVFGGMAHNLSTQNPFYHSYEYVSQCVDVLTRARSRKRSSGVCRDLMFKRTP